MKTPSQNIKITRESITKENNKNLTSPRLIKFLFGNKIIKLISFILALVLFLYVQYTSTNTRTIQIQVIQPNLPGELIFSRKLPSFIDVEFYGNAKQLDFDITNFQILLENPNPQAGSNIYRVKLYPDPPPGIKASYIKEFELFIDRVIFRELSVIPSIQLKLPKTHKLGYISSNPRTVILRGPYETLSEMSYVETEKLSGEWDGSEELISRRMLIQKLPDFVAFALNQPFQIEASVNILPILKTDYKIIKDVPVRCANEIIGIQMTVLGKSSVDIYLNNDAIPIQAKNIPIYVFCPVFFDEKTKTLKPSFLLQDNPVYSIDGFGIENSEIMKIIPPKVDLQFEWTEKKGTSE